MSASCNNSPADDPIADHSFLTQQPCAAPCWYGLEPDKSSESEVYATLNKLPFVDHTTITELATTWLEKDAKQIGFGCLHPQDTICGGSLIISAGKLKGLSLSPSYRLDFQMAAKQLGSPDYIEYHPWGGHGEGCLIALYWNPKGITVTSINRESSTQCREIQESGRVPPDVIVTQMFYTGREAVDKWPKTPFPGFAKP